MFTLRRNCKIGFVFLCIGLIVTSCGTGNKESDRIASAFNGSQIMQDAMPAYVKGTLSCRNRWQIICLRI